MERFRPYLAELTRALMVLALVLLNLAPGQTVAFDGLGFTASSAVNCGFADDPSQLDQILANFRKLQETRINANPLQHVTAADMLRWAKLQPVETRARFVRDVTALDAKDRKSVLSS